MKKIFEYLKLMRVKHYIKNLLIFFPLIFSGNLLVSNLLLNVFLSFLAFSFGTSVVYIFNDIKDIEKDKLHKTKCNRPLAKGTVSKTEAITLACILFVLAFTILFKLDNLMCILYLFIYMFLNVCYSLKLKNVPILDVAILTMGFVIRVMYGGAIINVAISDWLYLTVMSMSFYLSLGKRRNEIIKSQNGTREVLKYYNKNFLDKFMYLFLGLTIVFYSLWTVGNMTCRHSEWLFWSVPLLIFICMKYSMIIEGDSDGDPTEVIFHDNVLLGLCALFGMFILGIFYL